jgi:hypothetical protein
VVRLTYTSIDRQSVANDRQSVANDDRSAVILEHEADPELAGLEELARITEDEELAELRAWRDVSGFDLLSADTSQPIPWVPGAELIIRAGERQSWVASYGEGKTQAALHLAAQVAEAGGRVVYVDVENDAREMAERLQPIVDSWGAREAWAARAFYLDKLDLGAVMQSAELLRSWVAAIAPADLLIIDSWTRVLSQFGMDEDSNRDVTRFMRECVDPLAKYGIAVLILDNTGHDKRRARGAVSKAATVEAVYKVTGGKALSPTDHGTLKLTLARSRSGKLAKRVQAGSGGGEFDRLTPQDGTKSTERKPALAGLGEELARSGPVKISDLLVRRGGDPTDKKLKDTLRSQLNQLVREGLASRTPGAGNQGDVYAALPLP